MEVGNGSSLLQMVVCQYVGNGSQYVGNGSSLLQVVVRQYCWEWEPICRESEFPPTGRCLPILSGMGVRFYRSFANIVGNGSQYVGNGSSLLQVVVCQYVGNRSSLLQVVVCQYVGNRSSLLQMVVCQYVGNRSSLLQGDSKTLTYLAMLLLLCTEPFT